MQESKKGNPDSIKRIEEQTLDLARANEELKARNAKRKLAQKSMIENEKQFSILQESTPIGMLLIDAESRKIVDANHAAVIMIGHSKERIIDSVCHEFICPAERGKCPVIDLDQQGDNSEYVLLKADDTNLPVIKAVASVTLDGRQHLIENFIDITAHKQTEETMSLSDERFHQAEQLLAAITSILISVDQDDKVVFWNAAAERIFGIDASDAVGRPFNECEINWNWDHVWEMISECKQKAKQTRMEEITYKRLDGNFGELGMKYTPLFNSGMERSGFLLMGAEITKRRLMERQLVRAQKLESVGQLATGIAHEINTPTQFVGDNTQFLKDGFADLLGLLSEYKKMLEEARQGTMTPEVISRVETAAKDADVDYLIDEIPLAIQQSLEGIHRISKIVSAMQEFSHPGSDGKTAIDINKAIDSTITVARNEWKYVAEIETDFDPNIPLVKCLPSEFNQAILNLLTNAAHTIAANIDSTAGEKGRISLSTRHEGKWAVIKIKDTGTGIPDDIGERIFDPFFTTKGVGIGTGQGLSITHNVVVDKHGGSITFETEIGKGTTFIIHLPIDEHSTVSQES